MSDEATLRDAVVDQPADTSTETKETTTTETTTVKVADTEAAEIGKALLEAGFTKEQVPELLQTPNALNTLRYLVQNDPEEFLKQLEKTDPTTGQNFLQRMSDVYLKRNEHLIPKDGGKGKDDKNSELFDKIRALEEKANRLESEAQQRNAAAQTAALKQRYESKVDDLFSQKEIKELGLTKSDVKGMKARLSSELAQDPSAFRRIQNGNFVDIPKHFQTILDEHVEDKKSAIKAEKEARERSSSNAFAEFPSGPQPFSIDNKVFDSWDSTEEALASALGRTGTR